MSYASYFRSAPFAFPSGIAYLIAGVYGVQNVLFDRPPYGYKEISGAEYKASPVVYLQNDEHHRVKLPKVPGQSTVTAHPPSAHGH